MAFVDLGECFAARKSLTRRANSRPAADVVFTQQSVFQTQSARARNAGMFNRLALLRAERNVSRKALAEAVGVNFQTIGYLERGDYSPSLELALRISAFFQVPVEVLFSLTPFEPLTAQLTRSA